MTVVKPDLARSRTHAEIRVQTHPKNPKTKQTGGHLLMQILLNNIFLPQTRGRKICQLELLKIPVKSHLFSSCDYVSPPEKEEKCSQVLNEISPCFLFPQTNIAPVSFASACTNDQACLCTPGCVCICGCSSITLLLCIITFIFILARSLRAHHAGLWSAFSLRLSHFERIYTSLICLLCLSLSGLFNFK